MEILYLLIPMSVGLAFLIGAVFWWAVRSGQFEDLEGPAYRILFDEDDAAPPAPPRAHDAPAARDPGPL